MGRRALLKPDERRRLFGAAEDEEGLVRHYSLTLMDRAEALARRRPHNQLGCAVQLCLMRHPGRPLGPPARNRPRAMLAFVADQLGLKGDLFAFYGRREDTRLLTLSTFRPTSACAPPRAMTGARPSWPGSRSAPRSTTLS